jgi:hypothetical protein
MGVLGVSRAVGTETVSVAKIPKTLLECDARRPPIANMSLGGGTSTALDNAVKAGAADHESIAFGIG